MFTKRNIVSAALILGALTTNAQNALPPKPYGALPSPQQIAWQKMEYYMFIHFGPNTFTDKEWGDGKEDPKFFNPSHLDAKQWARTAKAAGMKAIIITAKHHDGFCLWPSKYSTHTVRESPWKNGKGDVLKELSEACKAYGLKFGVYLSPWDRNHPDYGTPKYNQTFANTLNEVLSNYGDVFEQWFDGANGEEAGGKKQVYDWPLFHSVVYKNQPKAIIFSDIGPGTRWIGNENGIAGETNWSTLNTKGFGIGHDAPNGKVLNTGNENGEHWIPGEADVSIRPGWFYSPKTDNEVKTLTQLSTIYNSSVGRNANLLLNVPVDRRGLIHANDSTQLMALAKLIRETFKDNLAKNRKVTASNVRGNAKQFGTQNLTDGNYETYWATNDDVKNAVLTLTLAKPAEINRLVLQEYIPLGQRVKSFTVEYWNGNKFVQLDKQTTIGYKRILTFPTVKTSQIRISMEANASPVIAEIQAYKAPEITDMPKTNNEPALSELNKTNWRFLEKGAVDMGTSTEIGGFTYTPDLNKDAGTYVYRYNFYVSTDGSNWNKIISNQTFGNIKNNPIKQKVFFDKRHKARYFKLEALSLVNGNTQGTATDEMGILVQK